MNNSAVNAVASFLLMRYLPSCVKETLKFQPWKLERLRAALTLLCAALTLLCAALTLLCAALTLLCAVLTLLCAALTLLCAALTLLCAVLTLLCAVLTLLIFLAGNCQVYGALLMSNCFVMWNYQCTMQEYCGFLEGLWFFFHKLL